MTSEMDKSLSDAFWSMRFGLRRSYFYHEKRVLFWRTTLFIAHGMEMALNSTAAAFIFNEGKNSLTKWFVLLSAIISFIVVWFNAEKRIQINMEKKAKFIDIEDLIPLNECEYTEKLLDDLKRKRRKIERDDDVVLPCVDALAYNDACRSFGKDPIHKLNILERTIGRMLPIPYK